MSTTTNAPLVNDRIDGFSLGDIVIIEHVKTELSESSWRGERHVGVVSALGETFLEITKADRETERYEPSKVLSDHYVVRVAKAAEHEFTKALDSTVANHERALVRAREELANVSEWRDEYHRSVSIIGQLARYAEHITSRFRR